MNAKPTLGSISHGTLRPEDLIPTFAAELERVRDPDCHADLSALCDDVDYDDDEEAGDILERLTDALSGYAPDYCYFGAHPGDGSDFGFWLCEDWQERAKEDDVLFVSDTSEIPDGYDGMVCHVNDHGNATMYQWHGNAGIEVWSVV
jgi:hypothetical protein